MTIKYKDYLCPYCDKWGLSKKAAANHFRNTTHTIARRVEFEIVIK